MIRFFRTIRKKLVEQSNVRKYLIYAVGEIALVMIGILLALQVNNWNEERSLEKESDEAIIELKNEVLKAQKELETALSYLNSKSEKRISFLNNRNKSMTETAMIDEIINMVYFYSEPISIPVLEREHGPDKKIYQWPELTDHINKLSTRIRYYNKGLEYIENDLNSNLFPFLAQKGLVLDIMSYNGLIDPLALKNANVYHSIEFRNVVGHNTMMINALTAAAKNVLITYDELLDVLNTKKQ